MNTANLIAFLRRNIFLWPFFLLDIIIVLIVLSRPTAAVCEDPHITLDIRSGLPWRRPPF